jgi:ketol-acid reductoisomerase
MSTEAPPLRVFGEADGDLRRLDGQTIAFIGYGNQGRAQALNLRDSFRDASVACDIVVATLRDSTWDDAERDGFAPVSVPEAAAGASVLFLLTPDEDLPEIFTAEIAPHLNEHDTLVFASGYNLTYKEIDVPANVDVVLLAPRMIGQKVRELFERGEGYYSYVAVEQDASGHAWETVLALAQGIGSLRLGAIELSADDETVIDLLMEQGFGAMLGSLIFQTLDAGTKAGLPPEALILELYLSGEMSGTFEAMAELGFVEQSRLHSRTSQYGGMTRNIALDREPVRKHLEKVLQELRDGTFAREWAAERAAGGKNFEQLQSLARQANPFTPLETRLREALRKANERR